MWKASFSAGPRNCNLSDNFALEDSMSLRLTVVVKPGHPHCNHVRPKKRSHKSASFTEARWRAYATAGAATALAAASTAEGHIHYFGLVNSKFKNSSGTLIRSFPLENGASVFFDRRVFGSPSSNVILFGITKAISAHPRQLNLYVSRLGSGENVSSGPFGGPSYGVLAEGGSFSHSYWRDPGRGFIGFEFNTGDGVQYGWARIKTTGANRNAFIVLDYAWGDPGDSIRTGQRHDADPQPQQAPASGSLALLALGGAGLVAWRRARSPSPA
jgi:hypothetical protein